MINIFELEKFTAEGLESYLEKDLINLKTKMETDFLKEQNQLFLIKKYLMKLVFMLIVFLK